MNSTCWEVLVSAPLEAQHPQSRVLELLHVALGAPIWFTCGMLSYVTPVLIKKRQVE